MLERILGIMKLDLKTYNEIEHDESATTQAIIIVAITSLLAAISAAFFSSSLNSSLSQLQGMEGMEQFQNLTSSATLSPVGMFINTLLGGFITWLLWSYVSTFVGTRFFGGTAEVGEMMRLLGFAQAPRLLSIIPCIGGFVGGIWALVCGYMAVREGLDVDNTKAIFTIVVSWLVGVVISMIIGLILAPIFAIVS